MRVHVLLFGAEAKAVGSDRVVIDLPDDGQTCADLRGAIIRQAPQLRNQLHVARFAVNHQFADDHQRIAEDDEVALIGLVGGG